jgi:hypothetical protein
MPALTVLEPWNADSCGAFLSAVRCHEQRRKGGDRIMWITLFSITGAIAVAAGMAAIVMQMPMRKARSYRFRF